MFGPSDVSTISRVRVVRVVVLRAGRCCDVVFVFVRVPGDGTGPDPGCPVGDRAGPKAGEEMVESTQYRWEREDRINQALVPGSSSVRGLSYEGPG